MKQIAIYGAFDRFNYGDILFPLVLERVLQPCSATYRLEYYGTIQSDLSGLGGKPTRSVEMLFESSNLEDGSIVIVAGGDVLGQTWYGIYTCHLPESLASFNQALLNGIPQELRDTIVPSLPTTVLDLPFVISPQDFSAKVRVVYNAVGGSSLASSSFPRRLIPIVRRKLQAATFVSVRDQMTCDLVNGTDSRNVAMLAPDSATLVSHHFPKANLVDEVSMKTRQWLNEFSQGYMVLQIARPYLNHPSAVDELAHEVASIFHLYRLPVVLCPIGTATWHEDHVPLQALHRVLNTPSILVDKPTIFEIMALIANARIFVGTSLHGAITAMSYAVPNLAITRLVPKVDAYLATWALPRLQQAVPVDALAQEVAKALAIPVSQLEQKRSELIDRSLESFDLLLGAIDNEPVSSLEHMPTAAETPVTTKGRFAMGYSQNALHISIERNPVSYREVAFSNYQVGNRRLTCKMALRAIFSDPRKIMDRGLISILIESIIGKKATYMMRRALRGKSIAE